MQIPNLIKVKDHDQLAKDMTSGAILNTDISVVHAHEKRMREIQKETRREREINNIKSEISEIKKLLQVLINKE
jgi:hypothetical protein